MTRLPVSSSPTSIQRYPGWATLPLCAWCANTGDSVWRSVLGWPGKSGVTLKVSLKKAPHALSLRVV